MKPLYEVWQALKGSQNPAGEWTCWGACWEGMTRVQLPLAEAKSYANALASVSGLPTEVRGKTHRVKAVFGMEAV